MSSIVDIKDFLGLQKYVALQRFSKIINLAIAQMMWHELTKSTKFESLQSMATIHQDRCNHSYMKTESDVVFVGY